MRAEVAQSVEQGTENPRVGSSILSLGTIETKGLRIARRALRKWVEQYLSGFVVGHENMHFQFSHPVPLDVGISL